MTDLRGIGDILRNARKAESCKGVMRAHLLLAFACQRVGEVVMRSGASSPWTVWTCR